VPSSREFRDAIGAFATGVAVVTASGADGPAGLTTNAVASLSLEPQLLIVCFDNASRTLPVVREAGRFAVNVLRAGQEELATVFASKRVAREKFAETTHNVAHGVPVLDDAAAWLACDLVELLPRGDHTIGIGAVTQVELDPDAEPLVFVRGAYRGSDPVEVKGVWPR
jgi:3-hydroxy-9,10-secoandrosta-1,3,5(10)-triene-9,17-dione monooxygenase reductase component